jgi:hypothetical protein
MTFSLNEIEAMSKRAARGAGLPWGLAEEAGKATRWLAAHGFAGPEILLDNLDQIDGKSTADGAPVSVGGVWRAPSGSLCPLVSGPALCDLAGEIAEGHEIIFGPVLQPVMLAAYMGSAAKISGANFELRWDDVVMIIGPTEASVVSGNANLQARSAESARCGVATHSISEPMERTARCNVGPQILSRLNTFAMRTFAPATEASRIAGAGAGLTDND